ncbi:hypothetical protein ACQ4M3_20625 [Leptolyngbya sp. AN03gr2]|uniref:hypothetical protein n=1 Tax=unclassified Leptolyngbya TaxID=2650499 RepID=UPI003D3155B3
MNSRSSCNLESIEHEDDWGALIDTLELALRLANRCNAKLSQNALHGELHPYPQPNGRIYYNYYPYDSEAPSGRKDKRKYVKLKEVAEFRAQILSGQKVRCLREIEAQVYALIKQLQAAAVLEIELPLELEDQVLICVKQRLQDLQVQQSWSPLLISEVNSCYAEICRQSVLNYQTRHTQKPPKRSIGEGTKRFSVYHYPIHDLDCIDRAVEAVIGRIHQ